MKPRFFILPAAKRPNYKETRHTGPQFSGSPSAFSRHSTYQLEQLVSKQGDDSKHEVKPDFLGSPHHDVAASKLFFQPAVKALRHRPFPVPSPGVSGQISGRAD